MKIDWTKLGAIVLPYLVARSKERATYVALVALLSAFGVTVTADALQSLCTVATVLASTILVAVPGHNATVAVQAAVVSSETKLGAGPEA